ncbi:Gfo/Idh/MocA family protein [Lapillicoccus jejuensis]|uniref:Putative dehydrogenase n=1 Tax=Lapillicoccus jejuensis TaxID=402171 RepID=A0A542E570_9MICO|nr:Gfo/Idh/MocA family oxidoreductase [Lapillicoccus jejuensis]TQJ10493.1 putative dehydrogenase [Lapillicoccus jejuensis]
MTVEQGPPLRVAVVGLGDISGVHLDAVAASPHGGLVAVADLDEARATTVGAVRGVASYGGGDGLDALEAMVERESPDVVHVCTPHDRHAPMATWLLEQGVHVLLEKPSAHTLAGAEALVEVAARSDAQLGLCFQNRYNTAARALRDLLDDGSLGAPYAGRGVVTWRREAAYYARSPWRGRWAEAGGGVLANQAIHTLDLLLWYLGDAADVEGTALRLALDGVVEVEDTATFRVRHDGGATSVFWATNGHLADSPVLVELLLRGDDGQAVARLETDLVVTRPDGREETTREPVLATGERAYWGVSHDRLVADFHAHVRDGRPFWIGAEDGARAMRVLETVYAASGLRG